MIHYVIGDATAPEVPGPKIVAHVCNDVGAWGKGFVLSLRAKYPDAERAYRNLRYTGYVLGTNQKVRVGAELWIVNMIAQGGLRDRYHPVTIRMDALAMCLSDLRTFATGVGASVHIPRIGCGLGGGKWPDVERLIAETMSDVEVYVYDLPTV